MGATMCEAIALRLVFSAHALLCATPRKVLGRCGAFCASVMALATIGFAMPAPAAEPHSSGTTAIELERVRPRREHHPTLRFLKENRDFIRARFDLLREKLVGGEGQPEAIDPRYLAYSTMLGAIEAGGDSVASAARSRAGLDLLTSITQLGQLEAELDLMDRNLAQQRERLGVLQADFTGNQRTGLMIVLSGYPGQATVDEIVVTPENGAPLVMALGAEQREVLRSGGVVQVFHEFVEPREQALALRITGEQWPAGDSAFVRLDPPRDRLTMLRLHLAPLDARGAASIEATTWLHDEQFGSREH